MNFNIYSEMDRGQSKNMNIYSSNKPQSKNFIKKSPMQNDSNKNSLLTNYLISTNNLPKKKIINSANNTNKIIGSTSNFMKENTINRKDLGIFSINPLTDSPELENRKKDPRTLFYHKKCLPNDLSSIKKFSINNEKLLNDNKYIIKKNNHLSSDNIFKNKSKCEKRNMSKINKIHFMTLKKNISLYESNKQLIDKSLKLSLEKNKNESIPNDNALFNLIDRNKRGDKIKISFNLDLDSDLINKEILFSEEEANFNLETINLNSDIKDIFKKCSLIKQEEFAIIEQNKKDIFNTLHIMKEYTKQLKTNFKTIENKLRNDVEEYKCKVKDLELKNKIFLDEIKNYKKIILNIFNKCIQFEYERITSEKENTIKFNQVLEENDYLRKMFLHPNSIKNRSIEEDIERILNTKYEPRRNFTEVDCLKKNESNCIKISDSKLKKLNLIETTSMEKQDQKIKSIIEGIDLKMKDSIYKSQNKNENISNQPHMKINFNIYKNQFGIIDTLDETFDLVKNLKEKNNDSSEIIINGIQNGKILDFSEEKQVISSNLLETKGKLLSEILKESTPNEYFQTNLINCHSEDFEIDENLNSHSNQSLNDTNTQEFCEIENIDSSLKDANFDIFSFSNFKNFKAEEENDFNEKINLSEDEEQNDKLINREIKPIDLLTKINTRNNIDLIDPTFKENESLKKSKNATYEKMIFTTDCTSTVGDNILKDNKFYDIFKEFNKSRNKTQTPEHSTELLIESNLLFKKSSFNDNNNDSD